MCHDLRRVVMFTVGSALAASVHAASAQTQMSQTPSAGVSMSGSVRTRVYGWNWFGADAGGDYAYPAAIARVALSQSHSRFDWQIEFAAPILLNLPDDAVKPAPAGQLGLGAAYFVANANRTNAAGVFLKQGFVRIKRLGGDAQSLRIGRMEFNDGGEVIPANTALAALKRDRISQRLIGAFGFTDVGRSIDGAAYGFSTKKLNVTAIAGRSTQGVFDVNGWPDLKVSVYYGAITGQVGGTRSSGEWRGFALGYDDSRHLAGKPDNRPASIRTADAASVAIATFGGHYIHIAETGRGPIDVLLWGAAQTGSWGTLNQRAVAFATEAGWQPRAPRQLNLWIRGGYDYASGDSDPLDGTHGTFFQVLPTPRIYARFPFFNMMNTKDAFGELVIRPTARFGVRADAHAIRLANPADFWYSGGGAFQRNTFGYIGRPSNGETGVATLYDASADWTISPSVALSAYYGQAPSGRVAQAIYRSAESARFGYMELMLRF